MPPPKYPNPPFPLHLLSELIALQPYIEHILCDGSRDPRVRAAVQDQVQTVLRKAIQHLPSYRPHKEGLRPWLAQIARNVRTDARRSAQSYNETFGHNRVAAEDAPHPGPSPESDAQARAFLDNVFAHIEEMPPEMRDVLLLAASCNDSHEEIAARLEITQGAAKMRLSRARKMLRKRAGTLRDHVGAFFFLLLCKLGAPRVPLLNRLRTFFWQLGNVLPPVFIVLAALPQLERATPMSTENVVVPVPCDERVVRHDVPVGKLEPASLPSVGDVPTATRTQGKPSLVWQLSPLPPHKHGAPTKSYRQRAWREPQIR